MNLNKTCLCWTDFNNLAKFADAETTNNSVKRTAQVCWQVTRHKKTAQERFFSLPPPLQLALICSMRVRRCKPHYLTLLDVDIDGLEEKLAHCRQSIEEVDLKLRRENLSPEGRKSLERERNLLMTKADNYEKELSVLRKENRKNAALAVAMGLLIALIYACWTM
ncbi:coiled-coil domain-containing protein 167 isoform X2 [Athene cunicularia]|uniref:coiled-coil domain-containing protein 167 isoform X2 n=1 Tax=Athene cunicularia TaxID=194338 RepID=UPI000EF6C6B2|nr:coiled-coil domain-containing protein 167 isoform X2 [Athene cunicularia]